MAMRETSKQAARRRAKTNAADDRAARPRRAKAPGAPDALVWQAAALEGAPSPARRAELAHAPSYLVAVDVLWAAVASARRPPAERAAEAPAPLEAAPTAARHVASAPPSLSTGETAREAASAPSGGTAPAAIAPGAAADRRRQIARRAYALAEATGFRVDPFHAWLRAEREVAAAGAGALVAKADARGARARHSNQPRAPLNMTAHEASSRAT